MENSNNAHTLSLREALSSGWKLYKEQFIPLSAFAISMYVFVDLLNFFFVIGSSGYIMFPIIFSLFTYKAYTMRQLGIRPSIKNLYFSSGDEAERTGQKNAFWTYFISVVFLFPLFLLLVIPGIIFAVYWSLSTFVALDQHLSGKKALDYSKSLVKGHWWKVFIIIFLSYAVPLILVSPYFLLPEVSLFPNGIVLSLLASIISSISALYFTHVNLAIYLKLKVIASSPPSSPQSSTVTTL